jgi:short-subunit dehydrogenase
MRDPKTILITGASSGIGEALAVEYATHGVFLALSGRDEARLAEIRQRCRNKGAMIDARVIDVTDAAAMAAWIAEIEAEHPLDLVVANAGVSAGTGAGGERAAQVRHVLAINIDGVMNTVLPAIEAMLARDPSKPGAKPTTKRGQIAIMSSLASFQGLPGAPAYCASKAAVRTYGEAMRGELHHQGIAVNVICPGYIRSRMTARNKFPMPMLMDADRAARKIRRGLRRNRGRIAFPLPMYLLIRLLAGLPVWLTDPMMRVLPKKEAKPGWD